MYPNLPNPAHTPDKNVGYCAVFSTELARSTRLSRCIQQIIPGEGVGVPTSQHMKHNAAARGAVEIYEMSPSPMRGDT